ncbi:MAG TPA: hypothetical protein VKU41_17555, partial [Polyangiaceae bacterium]|nr:hypothetical protein [Polyangiaceae bacterium]
FWDGNPGFGKFYGQNVQDLGTDPNNPGPQALISTTRQFRYWPETTKGSNGLAQAFNVWTPDSVWSTCGIQFRMVNFMSIKVNDFTLFANDTLCPSSGNDYIEGTLIPLINNDPRHVNGTATVIFSGRCTCPLSLGIGDEEGGARASPSEQWACFPLGGNGKIVPSPT